MDKEQEAISLLAEMLTTHKRRGQKMSDGVFNWLYGEIKRIYRDYNINLSAQLLQNALIEWQLDRSMEFFRTYSAQKASIPSMEAQNVR